MYMICVTITLGKRATLQDIFAVILIAVLRVKCIQSDQYLVKKCVSIDWAMILCICTDLKVVPVALFSNGSKCQRVLVL